MNRIEQEYKRMVTAVDEAEANRRFLEAADSRGLLDVAYATVDSPLGRLLVASTKRGLVMVSYLSGSEEASVQELAGTLSPRVLEAPGKVDEVRRELEEYFAGRRRRFDLEIDWALTRGFTRKILRATARIPYGSVSTYRDIARKAGNGRASRAAGNALGSNPIPIVVPCHRVVRTGGSLGGYTGGLEKKEILLGLEGAL